MHKWWEVIEGDCRAVMAGLEPESVDAIVCDPPYGLVSGDRRDVRRASPNPKQREAIGGFMGMKWDGAGVELDINTWAAAYRILKPGGHLLAFGGTRTYHRIAVAIEDAGFEIRDCLSWLYGSGFPKSLDVIKAIDKMAGAEREVVGDSPYAARKPNGSAGVHSVGLSATPGSFITAPATPEAERWAGWGTALKPAWEPVIVARKPLIGTVAANVLAHGTGALNIACTRIPLMDGEVVMRDFDKQKADQYTAGGNYAIHGRQLTPEDAERYYKRRTGIWQNTEGRWPANVALDEAAAEMLDAQSGERKSPGNYQRGVGVVNAIYGKGMGKRDTGDTQLGYGDTGGASRFFYVAKASRRERNAGLEGMPERDVHRFGAGIGEGHDPKAPSREGNVHPTVKPIALMRWLVRLVTPPGGLVVDPFNGSGSTGIAAVLEGFRYIGIEQSAEYAEIARRRIAWWEENGQDAKLPPAPSGGTAGCYGTETPEGAARRGRKPRHQARPIEPEAVLTESGDVQLALDVA